MVFVRHVTRAAVVVAVLVLATGFGAHADWSRQAAPGPDLQHPDIADARYGPALRNTLDLWKAPSPRPTPVVVFFHGGGFVQGDKDAARGGNILSWALQSGVSFASVNYQYAKDGVHLPVPMQDGARAVQFLRAMSRDWQLDPTRIAAYGVSAGSGISLWIGFHDDLAVRDSPDPVARQSSRLTVVGSINGQVSYDPGLFRSLLGDSPEDLAMLANLHGVANVESSGARSVFEASSPLTYLTRDDPPVFTYYAYELGPVPPGGPAYIHNPRFGVALRERMSALGIECVFRVMADYASGDLAIDKQKARVAGERDLFEFLRRRLVSDSDAGR